MNHAVTLSDSVNRIALSATMAVSKRAKALAQQGEDIIDLSAGEPDFPTPQRIRDAASRAMAQKPLGYTMVDGMQDLREVICAKFSRENGLSFTPNQVIVCPGGKAVLYNALVATLNSGDDVIIPTPCWTSYPEIVKFCGGTPKLIETRQNEGFVLSPEKLEKAITSRTRWLILNSPGNPTGAVYSADQLRALGKVLKRHPQVMVITDDIYEHLVYEGDFSTLAQICPDLSGRVLTVNGVSKGYAMTGWRIGYAGGPEGLIKAMAKVMSQTTSNACTLSQYAAIEALSGKPSERARFLNAYQRRRDLVLAGLSKIEGINAFHPAGAFYAFFNISSLLKSGQDDVDFCKNLLEQTGLALVPGQGFHAPEYVRLSYAASDEALLDGLSRLGRFVSGLR